jgi:hypothetical protein
MTRQRQRRGFYANDFLPLSNAHMCGRIAGDAAAGPTVGTAAGPTVGTAAGPTVGTAAGPTVGTAEASVAHESPRKESLQSSQP